MAGGNVGKAGGRSLSPYRVSSSGRFGFNFYDRANSDALSFAASGFGRKLPSNGQGTDVPDDAGLGSWIPTTSTEQVGGELARWFGADTVTSDEVFPRLRYFNRDLGLMA